MGNDLKNSETLKDQSNSTLSLPAALNALLADVFSLLVKTKSFHWHVKGSNFRERHLMFDDQAAQLYAMIDPIAERVRKMGATTITSLGAIERTRSLSDNDAVDLGSDLMVKDLADDNRGLLERLRFAHTVSDDARDVASASLIENWIDETEGRIWFLSAAVAA